MTALGAARELRNWLRTSVRKYGRARLCTELAWYRTWEKDGPSENQMAGTAVAEVQRFSPKQRPLTGLIGRGRAPENPDISSRWRREWNWIRTFSTRIGPGSRGLTQYP